MNGQRGFQTEGVARAGALMWENGLYVGEITRVVQWLWGASDGACSRLQCLRSKVPPPTGFEGHRKESVLALVAHILEIGGRSEMGSNCMVLIEE